MIRDVVFVKKEETLRNLLKILVERKIGGVPVIDDSGCLIGMVSDGDVLRALTPREQSVYDFYSISFVLQEEGVDECISSKLDWPVERIMTKRHLHYIEPEDEFKKILRILSRHRFKKIPVVNGAKRVVGVISRGDVLRQIASEMIEN